MFPLKTKAAKLLAVGDSIEGVAKTIGRSEITIKRWLLLPEFQAVITENLAGAALVAVVNYLAGGTDVERARLGLSVLKMSHKGVPKSSAEPKQEDDSEEDTDLSEFSVDEMRKLTGTDAASK